MTKQPSDGNLLELIYMLLDWLQYCLLVSLLLIHRPSTVRKDVTGAAREEIHEELCKEKKEEAWQHVAAPSSDEETIGGIIAALVQMEKLPSNETRHSLSRKNKTCWINFPSARKKKPLWWIRMPSFDLMINCSSVAAACVPNIRTKSF